MDVFQIHCLASYENFDAILCDITYGLLASIVVMKSCQRNCQYTKKVFLVLFCFSKERIDAVLVDGPDARNDAS
jgi:hypothetical protein